VLRVVFHRTTLGLLRLNMVMRSDFSQAFLLGIVKVLFRFTNSSSLGNRREGSDRLEGKIVNELSYGCDLTHRARINSLF
jgi:hypothetical protein